MKKISLVFILVMAIFGLLLFKGVYAQSEPLESESPSGPPTKSELQSFKYCAVPPLTTPYLPASNVMLILDNSISMFNISYFDGWLTPETSDDDWCNSGQMADTGDGGSAFQPNACSDYVSDLKYYGYFDPDESYEAQDCEEKESESGTGGGTGGGGEESSGQICKSFKSGSGDWSGNFLNWLTMRKVDVVRKVLTGGKTEEGVFGGGNLIAEPPPAEEESGIPSGGGEEEGTTEEGGGGEEEGTTEEGGGEIVKKGFTAYKQAPLLLNMNIDPDELTGLLEDVSNGEVSLDHAASVIADTLVNGGGVSSLQGSETPYGGLSVSMEGLTIIIEGELATFEVSRSDAAEEESSTPSGGGEEEGTTEEGGGGGGSAEAGLTQFACALKEPLSPLYKIFDVNPFSSFRLAQGSGGGGETGGGGSGEDVYAAIIVHVTDVQIKIDLKAITQLLTIVVSGGTGAVATVPMGAASGTASSATTMMSGGGSTGGLPIGAGIDQYTDVYYVVVETDQTPTGVIDWVKDEFGEDEIRFGLTIFNEDGDGGDVVVEIGDSSLSTDIKDEINGTIPNASTNLAEAFWSVKEYFASEDGPYSYELKDVPCAKCFAFLITEGGPNADSVPTEVGDYAGDNNYYNCTEASSSSSDKCYIPPPSNGSEEEKEMVPGIEDVALYAHINDLRDDLDGNQYLTLFSFDFIDYSSRGESKLLEYAALNGGFKDGLPNYYFSEDGYQLEEALKESFTNIIKYAHGEFNRFATSTLGSGFHCQAFSWQERIPGVSEEDDEGEQNTQKLYWLGDLAGFFIDSHGQLREDSNEDKMLSLTEDKVMKFSSIDLYDSNAIGEVTNPCEPTETSWDEVGKLWWAGGQSLLETAASNRMIYTTTDGAELIEFNDGAASNLSQFLRAYDEADAGNIINYIRGEDIDICLDSDIGSCDITGHRSRDFNGNIWKLGDIIYSTPRILSTAPLAMSTMLSPDQSYLDYLYQQRAPSADQSYQDYMEEKASGYLFVGANDGMLHCFSPGVVGRSSEAGMQAQLFGENVGQELWAYIPMNVLPYLKYLAYPTYCHIYYVDQRPMIIDAPIGAEATAEKTVDSWRTILINTLRFGGSPEPPEDTAEVDGKKVGLSSIFALDITNPIGPKMLWEFSDPNLDFTTSYPAVVRIAADKNTNGEWYVVLGSGPIDYAGAEADNNNIYVINLRDGTLEATLDTGLLSDVAYIGDCMAVDPNSDQNTEAIYCATVENDNISVSPLLEEFKGKILRIITSEDPNNFEITTLFEANGPITAPLAVAVDEEGYPWVFFGTGKYLSEYDKKTEDKQYIHGLKDTSWDYVNKMYVENPTTLDDSEIFDATNVKVSANASDFICMCEGGRVSYCSDGSSAREGDMCNCGEKVYTDFAFATASNCGDIGDTDWNLCADYIETNFNGWKVELKTSSPAERLLAQPNVFGGIAMFTTFKPSSDYCAIGGNNCLYPLYYKAGIANKESPVLLAIPEATEEGATSEEGKVEIPSYYELGEGGPTTGEAITVKEVGGEIKAYIQLSTGELKEIGLQNLPLYDKIRFWMEK